MYWYAFLRFVILKASSNLIWKFLVHNGWWEPKPKNLAIRRKHLVYKQCLNMHFQLKYFHSQLSQFERETLTLLPEPVVWDTPTLLISDGSDNSNDMNNVRAIRGILGSTSAQWLKITQNKGHKMPISLLRIKQKSNK